MLHSNKMIQLIEKNMPYKLIFILTLTFLFSLNSCSERERSNLFDPNGDSNSPEINFRLTSGDSIITLKWTQPSFSDYSGFNLYRKLEGETNFSLLTFLSKNQDEYNDYIQNYDISYKYYLTIVGQDNESSPTKTVQIVPGPDTFWVLDRWGFYILHLTYDLGHILLQYYGAWMPENLSFDLINKRALATYPVYHYIEIFNIETGEITTGISSIRYPYDCAFEPQSKNFWVTDSSGFVYTVNSLSGAENEISASVKKPVQIKYSPKECFYILDAGLKKILVFDLQGELTGTIGQIGTYTLEDPEIIEVSSDGNELYIVDQSQSDEILYRYFPSGGAAEKLCTEENITAVRLNPADNSIWISAYNGSSSNILQLSYQGIRLNSLEGFSYISDFQINPDNGNLIIADSEKGVVTHIRSDSSIVGTFSKAVYPSKVYIQ